MFFLSVHQDETIFYYITAAFKRARLSVGKGRPWLFFLCFIRQVFPLPRECSGRATPIPRRRRCTLIVADDVERAPLIAPSGRSTVLAPAEAVSPEPGIGFCTLLRGEFGGFARGVNAVSLRPAAASLRACSLVLLAGLAACAERQALPNDPTGRLFARGLDEITDLYIAPVSSRRLVLGGAARLSRLDDKFSISETPGPDKTYLVLAYAGLEVAAYPTPSHDDPHDWGALMGHLVAEAKAVSPTIAALSADQIDKPLFDGITAGLDRFSRYSSPDVARDQRAVCLVLGDMRISPDTTK